MFTLDRTASFTPARKPFQIDQFTHKNSDFGAISVTDKRSCASPILKEERHILARFGAMLWCTVNRYSQGPRRGWGLESFSPPSPPPLFWLLMLEH